jgi:peptide/nickel transport system permease protein
MPRTKRGPDPMLGVPAVDPSRAPEGVSLWQIATQQFLKHPLAKIALVVLGVLYTVSAFADILAPYPERLINARQAFQPPQRVYFLHEGRLVRPYVHAMTKQLDMATFETVWTEDRSVRYDIAFGVRREGPRDRYVPFPVNLIPEPIRRNVGIQPWATWRLFGLEGTSTVRVHLWGSDDLGGDVFSKILFGGRISLTIGILAAVVTIVVGMIMGGLAGYFGGWLDEIIMRFVEALSAIPGLFLLLALSAIFYPLNLPSSIVFPLIVVVLSLIGWGGVARTVRGQVLSLREREFALAAMALGASQWRIITLHLLPQTFSFVIITLSLAVPTFIITEAVLSFFGLGIQPPSTSWGLMLNTAQSFAGINGLGERWWIFIPGLFIFISVLAWNLLGDGLRDAFDPRSRQ